VWFTTSTERRKYHNITARPDVAMSVNNRDRPYRYLQIRGDIERIDPDPSGEFFDRLSTRYALDYERPVADAPPCRPRVTPRPHRLPTTQFRKASTASAFEPRATPRWHTPIGTTLIPPRSPPVCLLDASR